MIRESCLVDLVLDIKDLFVFLVDLVLDIKIKLFFSFEYN